MTHHFLIPRNIDPRSLKRRLDRLEIVDLVGDTMGTSWSAKVAGIESVNETEIRDEIEEVFHCVISQMSLWNPESEISRFNRLAAGSSLRISSAFSEVLFKAVKLYQTTSGAYSPFLAEVANALGFGPDDRIRRISYELLSFQLSRFQNEFFSFIKDLSDDRTLRQQGHIGLDLNGIAKGYAVDQIVEKLQGLGADGGFVEIGGDGAGFGCKPDGLPWTCGIEKPPGSSVSVPRYQIALPGIAFASSGNTRKFRIDAETRTGHVIDPQQLTLEDQQLLSVTVFDRSCISADALATALFVMGLEKGLKWAGANNIPAIFYSKTEEEKDVKTELSPAMDDFFE